MNENNIDNIDLWTQEILDFTKKSSLYEEYEGDRYEKLIFMAENTKEVKIVQGLIRCLEYELPGMDQTIYGVLATIDPLIYYTALFKLFPWIIQDVDSRNTFAWVLDRQVNYKFTVDEWEEIYSLAKKYLSKSDLEGIMISYIKGGLIEDQDYPYPQFYELFQKLLKEKSAS